MLGRLINALLATLGAAAAGQAPAFQAQYRQQLAGRLDQARQDIAQLLREAEARGQTPEQFLQRAEQESGAYTRILVEDSRITLQAYQRLQEAYGALSNSDPVSRPFILLQHLDPKIASSVASHFQPALPLNLEGLAYAGIGLLIGVAFAALLEYAGRSIMRSLRRMKGKPYHGGQHSSSFRQQGH
ncbi:DUF2937 family protein [Fodinicurvata sediminis]|uniref:DUF2937 family protein n=1 Tax=Fodinicurvata sediminis TaxID=1121832 RepID=UPI0003B3C3F3|nr:DUF2937 family protein [Fodinicurvata sediminis]